MKQLRQNNMNLGKVYNIIGTFLAGLKMYLSLKERCGIYLVKSDANEQKTMSENNGSVSGTLFQADKDGQISTLMWASGNSRLQYTFFGDVVTFDTTYRTNLYDMPFGLFVGVNNHFQTIMLVRDEKVETFEWVFTESIRMMWGAAQQTILIGEATSSGKHGNKKASWQDIYESYV